MENSKTARD